MRKLALPLLTLLLANSAQAANEFYCCQDPASGRRVCSDTLPEQCRGRAYRILDSGGNIIKEVGAPLSPEQCRRVVERFIRLDASRAQVAGSGLGLSIAQSIVQEHGGRIWAESDGVKTNTFAVRLPCTGCETAAGKPPA